jgi:hypothetical protein
VFGRNYYDLNSPQSLVALMDTSKDNSALRYFVTRLKKIVNSAGLNNDWFSVVALCAGIQALQIDSDILESSNRVKYPEELLCGNGYRNGTSLDVLVLFSTMLRIAQIPICIIGHPDNGLLQLRLSSNPLSQWGIPTVSKSEFVLDMTTLLNSSLADAIIKGTERYQTLEKLNMINVADMQEEYPPVSLPKHASTCAGLDITELLKLIDDQVSVVKSFIQTDVISVRSNASRLAQAKQDDNPLEQLILRIKNLLNSENETTQRNGASLLSRLQGNWEAQTTARQVLFQVIERRLRDVRTDASVRTLILSNLGTVGGSRTLEFLENLSSTLPNEPSVTPTLWAAINSIRSHISRHE